MENTARAAFAPPVARAGLAPAHADPIDVPDLGRDQVRPIVWGLNVLLLLVIVANDLATTVLGVRERTRENGVLRAVGLTPREISGSVVGSQVVLAAVAVGAGIPFGMGLFVGVYRLASGAVDPALAPAWQVVAVAVAIIGVIALVALVPARAAARRPVIDALRHEESGTGGARAGSPSTPPAARRAGGSGVLRSEEAPVDATARDRGPEPAGRRERGCYRRPCGCFAAVCPRPADALRRPPDRARLDLRGERRHPPCGRRRGARRGDGAAPGRRAFERPRRDRRRVRRSARVRSGVRRARRSLDGGGTLVARARTPGSLVAATPLASRPAVPSPAAVLPDLIAS